jgi:PAS domain-containing protein
MREDYMAVKNSSSKDILRLVFDAIPSLIFVVDDDVRIHEFNASAAEFLLVRKPAVLKRRGGEVLNCLHAADVPEGCGRAPSCKNCVVRNSVTEASRGNHVVRQRARLEILRDGVKAEIYALISASPFYCKERPFVLLVIEDISEIAELRRLIPICSVCKKVRDDKESWSRFEAYFKEHWDVDFSHGLCPECYTIEMDKLKNGLKN